MTAATLQGQLREVLARLAAPADEQEAYLRDLDVWPSADELALELEDLVKVLPEAVRRGEMTKEEEDLIRKVDDRLTTMSGEQNAGLWDAGQLAVAPEWKEVRRLAQRARERLCVG